MTKKMRVTIENRSSSLDVFKDGESIAFPGSLNLVHRNSGSWSRFMFVMGWDNSW